MTVSYRGQVTTVFEVLSEGLAPFVDERMRAEFGDEDWILVAASKLGKRPDVLVSLRDPHFQLEVLNRWWGPVFSPVLDEDARETVRDLRTARNHWAHPDPDHPFDLDRAVTVHRQVADLLTAVGSTHVNEVDALLADLRRQGVRHAAQAAGVSEVEALLEHVTELENRYEDLQRKLEDARLEARSASGRTRAVSRQLAELQTQYAAVSGLRDDYIELRRQLEAESSNSDDGEELLRRQLASAEMSLVGLQRESLLLRTQLSRARESLADVDPLETPEGRRWLWLMSALLLVMALMAGTTLLTVR